MKQYITTEQITQLSPKAQSTLHDWWEDTLEYDDDLVHVYIPEEKDGEYDGIFEGKWDDEYEFDFPEEYVGKLKRHEGTILPLLSIGEMITFLDEHIAEGWWNIEREGAKLGWRIQAKYTSFSEYKKPELCDSLWDAVKIVLAEEVQS